MKDKNGNVIDFNKLEDANGLRLDDPNAKLARTDNRTVSAGSEKYLLGEPLSPKAVISSAFKIMSLPVALTVFAFSRLFKPILWAAKEMNAVLIKTLGMVVPENTWMAKAYERFSSAPSEFVEQSVSPIVNSAKHLMYQQRKIFADPDPDLQLQQKYPTAPGTSPQYPTGSQFAPKINHQGLLI